MFLLLGSGNLEIGHKVQNLQKEKAKTKQKKKAHFESHSTINHHQQGFDFSPAGGIRATLRGRWIERT